MYQAERRDQGCFCLQHAVVVPGMHWNAVLPQVLKKNRHWSVSRAPHFPFCCHVIHYLWKQQTCKPVMQNMLHPHTGLFVPMVVTCQACTSDRHFCFAFWLCLASRWTTSILMNHGHMILNDGKTGNGVLLIRIDDHREPTRKYQEPSRAHQEISGTIQSPPGNNRNHREPSKK